MLHLVSSVTVAEVAVLDPMVVDVTAVVLNVEDSVAVLIVAVTVAVEVLSWLDVLLSDGKWVDVLKCVVPAGIFLHSSSSKRWC